VKIWNGTETIKLAEGVAYVDGEIATSNTGA
jgi:hypothetical protein